MRPFRRNALLLVTVGVLALTVGPDPLPGSTSLSLPAVSSSVVSRPLALDEAAMMREARVEAARASRSRRIAVEKATAARQAATERAARAHAAEEAAQARRAALKAAQPSTGGRSLSSTAYCLTGRMANGGRTYRGAVAGNAWPLGTRLYVSDSPYGPGTFTVADRIGHGSSLDFAMPSDCSGARQWGRRSITVRVV